MGDGKERFLLSSITHHLSLYFNLHPARFLLLAFGERDAQDAVFVFGGNRCLIDGRGHAELSQETPARSFNALLAFAFNRALATNDEFVVVETNLQRGAINAGQINCDRELTFGLVKVRGRKPVGAFNLLLGLTFATRTSLRRLLKQLVHVILQRHQISYWVPTSSHISKR